MNLNPLVLFGLAGALGLAGFVATQQYLHGQEDERKVPVLVAKTAIRVGDPVTAENSGFKEIAVSSLPQQPITGPEQFEGKYAGSNFGPGEVIVQTKVSEDFGNDSRKIPKGMRAFTTFVDKTKSHAGLLRPGDRVDVMGSFDVTETDPLSKRQNRYKMIRSVLGDVEVWAVGATVVGADQSGGDRESEKDTSRSDSSTVSLLLDPVQAVRLAGAESEGTLFLSLRHPDDDSDPGDISFVTSDLYGDDHDQNDRDRNARDRNARDADRPAADPAPADPAAAAARGTSAPPAPAAGSAFPVASAGSAGADADAAAAAGPGEVPTWTVTVHVGEELRMEEVVDLPAARAAGFTDAQIARRRRELRDPSFAAKLAADRAAAAAPANPFAAPAPRTPPPRPAGAAPALAAGPALDADGPADGLFPMPGR